MPYKDKEKAKESKTRYRLNNIEKTRDSQRKSREKNIQYRLWKSSKQNASFTNREHSIEVSDIIIPTYCPYFGFKLTNSLGKGRLDSNPSLDRIDNTKGYIKGNIQVISWKANRYKSNLTEEELIMFATNILKIHAITS